MKRYCLTQCFKRKLSNIWDIIFQISLVIGIFIIGAIVLFGLFWIIGYIAIYFGIELPKDLTITELGTIILIGIATLSWVSWMLFLIGRYIFNKTYDFAIARYEGNPYECNIFEECKAEPEDEDNAN